jgi:UDP-glucose 4-epimerase
VRVLVTGAGGFVGRHVAEQLSAGHEVLAPAHAELDLLQGEAVRDYLERARPDAIVHAAIRPGHRAAPVAQAGEVLHANLRMFFNLARCDGLFGRLILLSSGAVYGADHYRPRMPESYFGTFVPADEFGLSKYVCAAYAEARPDVVELRLFGVFGPGEDYGMRFISNAVCKAICDLPITIKQNRRFDYLWVEDVAPVVEHFLQHTGAFPAYNVCADGTYELRELAELVLVTAGKELPVVVANPGLGVEYSGDNARLRAELPALALTPVEEAVRRLRGWYEANRGTIDRSKLLIDP